MPCYASRSKTGLSSSGLVGAQGALSTGEVNAVSGGGSSTVAAAAATEGSGGVDEKVHIGSNSDLCANVRCVALCASYRRSRYGYWCAEACVAGFVGGDASLWPLLSSFKTSSSAAVVDINTAPC